MLGEREKCWERESLQKLGERKSVVAGERQTTNNLNTIRMKTVRSILKTLLQDSEIFLEKIEKNNSLHTLKEDEAFEDLVETLTNLQEAYKELLKHYRYLKSSEEFLEDIEKDYAVQDLKPLTRNFRRP